MTYVIKIFGLVNGGSTAFDGQYLVEYDPNRDGTEPGTDRPMLCYLVTTPDVGKAQVFASLADAHLLWMAVDDRDPVRPDGQPNRPLTAFTVEVAPA